VLPAVTALPFYHQVAEWMAQPGFSQSVRHAMSRGKAVEATIRAAQHAALTGSYADATYSRWVVFFDAVVASRAEQKHAGAGIAAYRGRGAAMARDTLRHISAGTTMSVTGQVGRRLCGV
jgi:hypothetical protein